MNLVLRYFIWQIELDTSKSKIMSHIQPESRRFRRQAPLTSGPTGLPTPKQQAHAGTRAPRTGARHAMCLPGGSAAGPSKPGNLLAT